MNNIMKYAASQKNPPKGYGSINAGMEVARYRSERMKYWKQALKVSTYTDEVFTKADDDVIAKYGNPF